MAEEALFDSGRGPPPTTLFPTIQLNTIRFKYTPNGLFLDQSVQKCKMKFHNLLEDVLGNAYKVKILRVMVKYGVEGKEFYVRELARLLKENHTTIARNIVSLMDENLIKVRYAGNVYLSRINKEHPIFSQLSLLFKEEENLFENLKQEIKRFLDMPNVLQVVLFGSTSKGHEKPSSDIDLFVVVKNNADLTKIESTIDVLNFAISKKYGNVISARIKKVSELKELKKKALYDELKEGIILINKGIKW